MLSISRVLVLRPKSCRFRLLGNNGVVGPVVQASSRRQKSSSRFRLGGGHQQQQQQRGGGGTGSGSGGGRGGRSTRIPTYVWVTAGGVVCCYFAFLDEVPVTKRKRWIATSPAMEQQLGDDEYQQLLRQFRGAILPPNHPASRTVQRVGRRIAAASFDFAKEHNLTTYCTNPYTYTVIRSDMANAFVLPGNHIFVMTGLFRYVHNEDELAGVLGHEVSHVMVRHAGEKISGNVITNICARLLLLLDPSGLLVTVVLPAATVLRDLPHSRTQETEADQLGVYLSAKACYDPRASKRVFANMKAAAAAASDNHGPEFLSTHPSHESRISNFDKWMPEAMEIYQSDGGMRCRRVRRGMDQARRAAAYENAARSW